MSPPHSHAQPAHPGHDPDKTRLCPVCQESLTAFYFNQVETDLCHQGCGVWFDAGELAQVERSDTLQNIDQAFPGEAQKTCVKSSLEAPRRICPAHQTVMERYEWNLGSGVVLDRCPDCHGIWMDAGELESYSDHVKNFRTSPPQMTPEIALKMAQVQQEIEQQWALSHQNAANKAVPWDLWILDDLRRHLIKTVLRYVS